MGAWLRADEADTLWFSTDSLIDAWLRAAETDTARASADSLPDVTPLLLSGARAQPILMLGLGLEVEGLRESFGVESLLSDLYEEDASGVSVQPEDALELLRFGERETAPLGVVELFARNRPGGPVGARLDLEAKAGRLRRAVTAEGQVVGNRGPWAGLALSDLLLWDREVDESTNMQNLLYLRWRRPIGGRWRLGLRGTHDYSRVTSGIPFANDSTGVLLTFLNYNRVAVRCDFSRLDWTSSMLALDLSRKWVEGTGAGSYRAMALLANQSWFLSSSMLDVDVEVQRRRYEGEASSLASFWDTDVSGRWFAESGPMRIETYVRFTGMLYDDAEEENDDLSLFARDRWTLEAEVLLRRYLRGGPSPTRPGVFSQLEVGLGPTIEMSREEDGASDANSLGGRLVTSVRGGGRQWSWWLDLRLESGRRDHLATGDSGSLSFGDITFTLSQTDYTYLDFSLIGGGGLPLKLQWEGYLALDREWHALSAEDADLLFFSIALKRRFAILGP